MTPAQIKQLALERYPCKWQTLDRVTYRVILQNEQDARLLYRYKP